MAVSPSDFFDDDASEGAIFTYGGIVWRWKSTNSDAPAAWFFLTIDGDTAAAIRASAGVRRGFGSIRVAARIGETEFQTSIFPSKETGGWLLPLKAAVRKAERLAEGDAVEVMLELEAAK